MRQWLQYHRYAIAVTWARFIAQPTSFISNVVVLALALTMPLVGASVLISVHPLTKHVSANPAVTIFMQSSASEQEAQDVANAVRQQSDPTVMDVQVVEKETALSLLSSNDAWRQALEVLPENPLPHAVTVTLVADVDMAGSASRLMQTWQAMPAVERVQFDSVWIRRIEALMRLGQIGLLMVTLIIALVVLTAVFNTVRMQALSHKDEIAVARLVGATEAFVRRPFLYQGGLACAIAALLAIGLARLVLLPLNDALGLLAKTYESEFALHLPSVGMLLLYLLGAVCLGALSARWSVTRHTRY
jgi:cell division transport system permease protein